jgi:hypothetical protein
MIARMSPVTILAVTAFAILLVAGCSNETSTPQAPTSVERDGHATADHDHAASDAAGHEHGGPPLSEDDVKTPDSFAAGVARLKELHQQISDLIENNKLSNVHRTAEEMAIVARKMKPLAARDISEDRRADAGRLCNEIVNYFRPIDEVADAGKKDETVAIHNQMGETISKLEELTE